MGTQANHAVKGCIHRIVSKVLSRLPSVVLWIVIALPFDKVLGLASYLTAKPEELCVGPLHWGLAAVLVLICSQKSSS